MILSESNTQRIYLSSNNLTLSVVVGQRSFYNSYMLNSPFLIDPKPSNSNDAPTTWIQAYPSISGREFSTEYVQFVVNNNV